MIFERIAGDMLTMFFELDSVTVAVVAAACIALSLVVAAVAQVRSRYVGGPPVKAWTIALPILAIPALVLELVHPASQLPQEAAAMILTALTALVTLTAAWLTAANFKAAKLERLA